MAILIGAFLLSMIPSVVIYFWLKKQNTEETQYPPACRKSLFSGMTAVVPVVLLDIVLILLRNYVFLRNAGDFAKAAYYDFVLHAFAEELVKFLLFRRVLDKTGYSFSWRDLTAFMICVAVGFHFFESVLYAFTTSPGQILVRGVLAMHSGYAYIMGKYYGKAKATGNKAWYLVAFGVPWLLHGLYDFGLSPELGEEMTVWGYLSVILAAASLFFLIRLILFFRKAKKNEIYTRPLFETAAAETENDAD